MLMAENWLKITR